MIMGKILRTDGVTVSVLGLTKSDLEMLVKNETVGAQADGIGTLLIIYSDDNETLELALKEAGKMMGTEAVSTRTMPQC